MIFVNGFSIGEAYIKLLNNVLSYGSKVKDERGYETVECTNMVTRVTNPLGYDFGLSVPVYQLVNVPNGCFWGGERLKVYCEEFLDKNRNGFVYTYGNRLRGWFDGTDQIQVAIDRLRKYKNSRRAVSITWDVETDTRVDDVPCLMLVDFKIRDGKLETTAVWRSHDIYGAWFPNVVGLTYLTQYVAKQLDNINIGSIVVHSISAHVYMNDYNNALRISRKNKRFGVI